MDKTARLRRGLIFDTHAHYDDPRFDEDREILLGGMEAAGVGLIVNVAAERSDLLTGPALAQRYGHVYCALGFHPSNVGDMTEADLEAVRRGLTEDPKAVALGEIGLDYHWEDDPPREVQQHWFRRQLALAGELKAPVIIHSRDAAEDSFEILREFAESQGIRDAADPEVQPLGVVHCYAYSAEMAQRFVKLGYLIGIGGVLTFKNARKTVETVEALPLSALVLETDSPYLAPEPWRGQRNDSAKLSAVAARMAGLKGVDTQTVIDTTAENAARLYRMELIR